MCAGNPTSETRAVFIHNIRKPLSYDATRLNGIKILKNFGATAIEIAFTMHIPVIERTQQGCGKAFGQEQS